jgi:hypothetical protein
MNEKDIRDRIGQFLKKTARTVVVPASMGFGLSTTSCNGNGLKTVQDAGLDSAATQADARTTGPDLADASIKEDLPLMMVPYLVAMAPDAGLDTAPVPDADRDVFPDAGTDISFPPPPYLAPRYPDAATDIPSPPPPYLAPPPPDAATDGARADADKDATPDLRRDIAFPPPVYLIPHMIDDPLPGPPDKK